MIVESNCITKIIVSLQQSDSSRLVAVLTFAYQWNFRFVDKFFFKKRYTKSGERSNLKNMEISKSCLKLVSTIFVYFTKRKHFRSYETHFLFHLKNSLLSIFLNFCNFFPFFSHQGLTNYGYGDDHASNAEAKRFLSAQNYVHVNQLKHL